jgi:hypothetical protein
LGNPIPPAIIPTLRLLDELLDEPGAFSVQASSDRLRFIQTVAPLAMRVRIEGGSLFPSVLLAQTILETGGVIHDWNNIVGYKVGSGQHTPYWSGRSVNTRTREVIDGVNRPNERADWRAYDTILDCLKDQALLFLNNRGRYQAVIDSATPEEQARALYECGYATDAPAEIDGDPAYYEKIQAIIRSGGLSAYDQEAAEGMELLNQLQEQVNDLQRKNGELRAEVQVLRVTQSMDVPAWAAEAVGVAVNRKDSEGNPLIDTPNGGSLDFYRILTVMHRANLFNVTNCAHTNIGNNGMI